MALSEQDREMVRAAAFQVNAAIVRLRALRRHVGPGDTGRAAALAITAAEEAWLRVQQVAWDLAGLDGLPEVDRPWEDQ